MVRETEANQKMFCNHIIFLDSNQKEARLDILHTVSHASAIIRQTKEQVT